MDGVGNKVYELMLLIHDTHADIITIQETKLTPKAKTPKVHNFTTVLTDSFSIAQSVSALDLNFERVVMGSFLTVGKTLSLKKTECNNSGNKLTGLTWWP